MIDPYNHNHNNHNKQLT